MTLEEIRNMPPIPEERLAEIKAIKDEDVDLSDIPELTPEQIASMKPAMEIHPEWFAPNPN